MRRRTLISGLSIGALGMLSTGSRAQATGHNFEPSAPPPPSVCHSSPPPNPQNFLEDLNTYLEIRRLDALFSKIVQRGLGESYVAPLYTGEHDMYLGGGLDPISVIKRYRDSVTKHPSGVMFVSPNELGSPEFSITMSLYPGGREEVMLFRSEEHKQLFTHYHSNKSVFILNGFNCLWGAAAEGLTCGTGHSHWAQPAFAQIVVITLFRGSPWETTAVGLNLKDRGPDWVVKGNSAGIAALKNGYQDLLKGRNPWEESKRQGMPIFQRHDEFPIYRPR